MERTIKKALRLARLFPQTIAFGVSGSFAQNKTDQYSDYDFCIFTDGEIPDPNRKRDIYKTMGITEFDYFDVDFEISNGDGFAIDDHECGFIWMDYQRSLDLLNQLNMNWDLNEYLPGGIERMRILYESNNEIRNLKDRLYYTNERSVGRFKLFINRAHHAIYALRWLEKAVFRNDYYSFHKNSFEAIEHLVYALYALNKKWMADEKRILQLVGSLGLIPQNLENRLKEIILHTNGNEDLNRCFHNIKALFMETIAIFSENHGNEPIGKPWN